MSIRSPAPARRLVEPSWLTHPEFVETFGPEVADVCDLAGFPPDPQQELLLDLAFAIDRDAVSAAFELCVVAARQNMKTGFFKQYALGCMFVIEVPLLVWSAHEMDTTRESHRELKDLILDTPVLAKRLPVGGNRGITVANGREAIELADGRRTKFKARTKTGARGLAAPRLMLDEAFALTPEHVSSVYPVLLAQPDPQVVLGSSPGMVDSVVLRSLRDRGRRGDARLAYAEWAAPREDCEQPDCSHAYGAAVGCALDREHLIVAGNPAISTGRIRLQTVLDLRRSMDPGKFARECLGWWDEPVGGAADRVDPGRWQELRDPLSQIVGVPGFAVDVTPDRGRSSLVAAGLRGDGRVHVEVVRADRGSAWVVPLVDAVTRRAGNRRVVLDPAGPAGGLVGDLEAVGVDVVLVSAREHAQACGWFADAVAGGGLRHLGQVELDSALSGAATRDVGDGLWLWSRRSSLVDISPLVGATLAASAVREQLVYDVLESVF